MKIEMRPIAQIKPYPQNPRVNDAAVAAVVASLKEFGWRQAIVVDGEDVIVVGHTRHKAAQKMGLSEVPVHVATDLSPAQIRAYRIADNATGEIADWNLDILPLELKGLQEMDFDLKLLGFGDEQLLEFMSGDVTDGLTDPDDIPAPPDDAITQAGDLWILGDHRLLCGDSSKPDDVDRLLDGATIQLVHMDPPYNVAVEPRSNNAIAAGNSSFPSGQKMHVSDFDLARFPGKSKPTTKQMRAKDRPLANDAVTDEQFALLLRQWFGNASRVLDPGRAFYVWGGYANVKNYPAALSESELYFSQAIIWVKHHPVLGRKDFMSDHEWAFYGWKEGAAHKFFGPNNLRDVWEVKKLPHQQMDHLTQKPAELGVRAMQASSLLGENVLDLFGGSGSTMIAAEQTGRKAYLMELDPAYCDIIADRYQRFSGKPAVLQRTGESPLPMKPREEAMR
ncbi:MAG: ParB domain protein nuclease [Phycisphaerales bacterium]|nr:ParB domain protein nuclease [Phycisphaerales bacterium]